MSKLKAILAKKLTPIIGEVLPDDIAFHKNGARTDVVRWSLLGFECFSSASLAASNKTYLLVSEAPSSYGTFEIFVLDKDVKDIKVRNKKPHCFSTSKRY